MREKLSFNRNQLKDIFKDFESIKEFERLLSLVDGLSPSTTTDLEIAAESADAKAQEGLESISRLVARIDEILAIPTPEKNNSLKTDYIDFYNTGVGESAERRMKWNSADGTLDIGLYGGSVLQCGQAVHAYAQCDEVAMVPNGTAVMISGVVAASNKLKFKKAVASGATDENYMLGITSQNINPGEFGYVTVFGVCRGFDTTGGTKGVPEVWANNDILYFDPAAPGELTKVEPVAPNLDLPVATVINAAASGSIFVKMKTGERMNGIHDVAAAAPRDLDLLQYSTANSRWESGALPWVDIDFPIIIRTTGANIPVLAALNGNITMPQWQVNDYNVCESQELIHGWKEGSEIFWHLHLTTNGLDATDRYVRFELEYGYVDVMGVWQFPAVFTTPDILIPANTTSKTMMIVDITSFTPAIKIAGHVVARLKRVAAVGAAPTNNPWIPMLQLHVQLDTMGSRNIGTK